MRGSNPGIIFLLLAAFGTVSHADSFKFDVPAISLLESGDQSYIFQLGEGETALVHDSPFCRSGEDILLRALAPVVSSATWVDQFEVTRLPDDVVRVRIIPKIPAIEASPSVRLSEQVALQSYFVSNFVPACDGYLSYASVLEVPSLFEIESISGFKSLLEVFGGE